MLKALGMTLGAVAIAAPASAGTLELFDAQTQWLLSVDGPVVSEGFEGPDALGPLGSPFIFDSGLAVDWFGPADVEPAVVDVNTQPLDLANANTTPGGSQFLRFGQIVGSTPSDYTQQYLLPQSTNAFAFNIADWEPGSIDNGPQVGDLDLYNDGSLVFSAFLSSDNDITGLVSFIGFTSDGFVFDEVRFTVREGFTSDPALDVTGVDEVSWVVPAPSGVALLGLGALAACRRRR